MLLLTESGTAAATCETVGSGEQHVCLKHMVPVGSHDEHAFQKM